MLVVLQQPPSLIVSLGSILTLVLNYFDLFSSLRWSQEAQLEGSCSYTTADQPRPYYSGTAAAVRANQALLKASAADNEKAGLVNLVPLNCTAKKLRVETEF